jgi:hypothetical protein
MRKVNSIVIYARYDDEYRDCGPDFQVWSDEHQGRRSLSFRIECSAENYVDALALAEPKAGEFVLNSIPFPRPRR